MSRIVWTHQGAYQETGTRTVWTGGGHQETFPISSVSLVVSDVNLSFDINNIVLSVPVLSVDNVDLLLQVEDIVLTVYYASTIVKDIIFNIVYPVVQEDL